MTKKCLWKIDKGYTMDFVRTSCRNCYSKPYSETITRKDCPYCGKPITFDDKEATDD